ncbi:MAG: phosphate ABC transporter permease PstA [Pirellulales bacterium]|nr:phosphate ABC transporter permease PstA [Pirellulales bacterium]
MSSDESPSSAAVADTPRRRRGYRRQPSNYFLLKAQGEPLIWLTGGALFIALAMIFGLIGYIVIQGGSTFWPAPIQALKLAAGGVFVGELQATDTSDAAATRWRFQGSNQLNGGRMDKWVRGNDLLSAEALSPAALAAFPPAVREPFPRDAVVVERLSDGKLIGILAAFVPAEGPSITDPALALAEFEKWHRESQQQQASRLKQKQDEEENAAILVRVFSRTNEGVEIRVPLPEIVRLVTPNQLGWFGKLGVYASRWWEFVSSSPREANLAGGVFPCIWGTVAMTLFMSILVTPFGVLAALYLREYAQPGLIVSMIRIAINNLAGVPSIVFGAFGLFFFCTWLGGGIDRLFYPAAVAEGQAVFGKGGLLWASLTMSLLTLPVVIVATEEALAAVPNSMREGSYACGASKWQTIRRIVLPRALPGIMTGLILAMARGAGEVAPLMLVGVVKQAPDLPLDWNFPFLHLERSFMHLSYHVFNVGFLSPNSAAAMPLVMTSTLLLIAIITILNVTAIWLRNYLRRKYQSSQF